MFPQAGLSTCQFQGQVTAPNVKRKKGNVEINISPQKVIEPGLLHVKSSTLLNELKRYSHSIVLVVLVNPKPLQVQEFPYFGIPVNGQANWDCDDLFYHAPLF